MSKLRPDTKIKILMRDGFHCIYCQKKICRPSDLTFDHILPKYHGGADRLSNLATCCKGCNTDKGKMLLTSYLRQYDVKITLQIAKYL
jgi:5-methylcytosine-specific restriction endonuclease McrA